MNSSGRYCAGPALRCLLPTTAAGSSRKANAHIGTPRRRCARSRILDARDVEAKEVGQTVCRFRVSRSKRDCISRSSNLCPFRRWFGAEHIPSSLEEYAALKSSEVHPNDYVEMFQAVRPLLHEGPLAQQRKAFKTSLSKTEATDSHYAD